MPTWWPTGLGRLLGVLVLLGAFVLGVVGQMDVKEAGLIGLAGFAIAVV